MDIVKEEEEKVVKCGAGEELKKKLKWTDMVKYEEVSKKC